MNKCVLVINGPNLNLLGLREPEVYGTFTLADIEKLCTAKAKNLNLDACFKQSNSEVEIIEWIQSAREKFDGIIINPAAYSHTSIAIMDALKAFNKPIIEVHISNIFKRETFRHNSYVSLTANGVICGLGIKGYELAFEAIKEIFNQNGEKA